MVDLAHFISAICILKYLSHGHGLWRLLNAINLSYSNLVVIKIVCDTDYALISKVDSNAILKYIQSTVLL